MIKAESTPETDSLPEIPKAKPQINHVRVSKAEVISAVVKLLSPFADADSMHLKEERFQKYLYNNTGLIVVPDYKGNPEHIEFKFFMNDEDRKNETSLFIGHLFRMPDFFKDPKGYITGMMDNLGLSMHAYSTWRKQNPDIMKNNIILD